MPRRLEFADRARRAPVPPVHTEGRRPLRTRPRDPDEEEALIKLCEAIHEHWIASGRLVRLGPRHYEYHLASLREGND